MPTPSIALALSWGTAPPLHCTMTALDRHAENSHYVKLLRKPMMCNTLLIADNVLRIYRARFDRLLRCILLQGNDRLPG
jgi:hypothetical protein